MKPTNKSRLKAILKLVDREWRLRHDISSRNIKCPCCGESKRLRIIDMPEKGTVKLTCEPCLERKGVFYYHTGSRFVVNGGEGMKFYGNKFFDKDGNELVAPLTSVITWVPVSERLPGYGVEVLVVGRAGRACEGYYDDVDNEWLNPETNRRLGGITHWAEIPQLPTSEEQNE